MIWQPDLFHVCPPIPGWGHLDVRKVHQAVSEVLPRVAIAEFPCCGAQFIVCPGATEEDKQAVCDAITKATELMGDVHDATLATREWSRKIRDQHPLAPVWADA